MVGSSLSQVSGQRPSVAPSNAEDWSLISPALDVTIAFGIGARPRAATGQQYLTSSYCTPQRL